MLLDSPNIFVKDPNAKLDYSVDWTNWLVSDTIVTGTWVVPSGITNVLETYTTKISTIWVLGGSVGASYDLINRITTAAGRIDDRTITLVVREK